MAAVFDKVKDILCDQLDVEEDAVTMEANIIDDLGLTPWTWLTW